MDIDSTIPDPEIPDPKRGSGKREITPSEAEVVIMQAATEVVSAQGSLNILSHLQNTHLKSQEVRIPSDKNEDLNKEPLSEIERFYMSDHPSHLLKITDLEKSIEASKQTTSILDETDVSGQTLWDHIPKETRIEIETQLDGLKNLNNVREQLDSEISSFCGELWESHKVGAKGNETAQYLHLETLLLGEEPNLDERTALQTQKDSLLNAQQTAEMITFEKSRIAVQALIAPVKTRPEKEEDARALLGDEFDIIKAQVEHMKTCLQKDWATCDSDVGIDSPTAGEDLICPQLKSRLEGGKASPEQIKLIETAYGDLAARKTKADMDDRENLNATIGMTLATMAAIETGKKAKYVNLLSDFRDINDPTLSEDKVESAMDRVKKFLKEKAGMVKRGVGRIGKQWPQMMSVYLLNKLKKEDKSPYANHEEFVAWMKEAGMHHVDQAM